MPKSLLHSTKQGVKILVQCGLNSLQTRYVIMFHAHTHVTVIDITDKCVYLKIAVSRGMGFGYYILKSNGYGNEWQYQ